MSDEEEKQESDDPYTFMRYGGILKVLDDRLEHLQKEKKVEDRDE